MVINEMLNFSDLMDLIDGTITNLNRRAVLLQSANFGILSRSTA